jgi:hypothetical protein
VGDDTLALYKKVGAMDVRSQRTRQWEFAFDGLAVSAIGLVAASAYITQLGLYADDWDFLRVFTFAPHSFWGRLSALASVVPGRPGEALFKAAAFSVGTRPLVLHILEMLLVIVSAVAIYVVLRQLRFSRVESIICGLFFATMPNFSTDRFWISSGQAGLSILLYLLSLSSALYSSTAPSRLGRVSLMLASVLCLIGSVLSYELTVPLFGLNIYLIVRSNMTRGKGGSAFLLAVSLGLALVSLVIFKALTPINAWAPLPTPVHLMSFQALKGLAHDVMVLLIVHFGEFFFDLGQITPEALRFRHDTGSVIAAVIVCSCTALVVYNSARSERDSDGAPNPVRLIRSGTIVFVLGFAILFFGGGVAAVGNGLQNRTQIASSIGVAMIIAGAVCYLAGFLRPGIPQRFFLAVVVGLLTGAWTIVDNAVGQYWADAAQQQLSILADLRGHVPARLANRPLLLMGTCPYVGTGIVFESNGDLAGALALAHNVGDEKADVIFANAVAMPQGIQTRIYGMSVLFPYREEPIVFDARAKTIRPVRTFEDGTKIVRDAARYARACPPGHPGYGVPIWPIDQLIFQHDFSKAPNEFVAFGGERALTREIPAAIRDGR